MAEKLDEFERRKREPKYPWDQWLDGSPWRLNIGTDYEKAENVRNGNRPRGAQTWRKNQNADGE